MPATIEDDAVRFDLFLDPFQQVVDASLVHLECENERPREAEHELAGTAGEVLGADIHKLDGLDLELLEKEVQVLEPLERRLGRFDVAAARGFGEDLKQLDGEHPGLDVFAKVGDAELALRQPRVPPASEGLKSRRDSGEIRARFEDLLLCEDRLKQIQGLTSRQQWQPQPIAMLAAAADSNGSRSRQQRQPQPTAMATDGNCSRRLFVGVPRSPSEDGATHLELL